MLIYLVTKEVDTAGNDSNVIIIQKKVPEKQNLANTTNSLKTKHGANSDGKFCGKINQNLSSASF